jgi:hypothetical protein
MPNEPSNKLGRLRQVPQSDHDWTIHSLNIHGTLFERKCRQVIEQSTGWSVVAVNDPVGFPRYINEPHSGHNSSLDIHAESTSRRSYDPVVTLLIECKKHNPDFIDWVLFSDPSPRDLRLGSVVIHRAGEFRAQSIKNTSRTDKRGGWTTKRALTRLTTQLPLCTDARETRGTYNDQRGNTKKTKTTNDNIENAARQIAIAAQCVGVEKFHTWQSLGKRLEEASGRDRQDETFRERIFIVPMIVTTANLMVCHFDTADIDIALGEIPFDRATLEPVDAVMYEYPLPLYLQHVPDSYASGPPRVEGSDLERMDILVVRSSALSEALKSRLWLDM